MIKRDIAHILLEHIKYFPVLALTGPRQSGKSTIIKETFKDYQYYNLEDKGVYERAKNDPTGFITNCPDKTIIDEAQLLPDLFSAIQIKVDNSQLNGNFILTGSHNFLLQKNIGQSLAGRVSNLKLLPLSFNELQIYEQSVNSLIFKGGYPRLYNSHIPQTVFFANYIETYINRDVKGFLDVRDGINFEAMLRLLAANCGSILNYSRFANDLKIDTRTVKNWISILVASSIIFLLPPYFNNIRKSTIKSPKIYFTDTGLLCNLLKIKSSDSLYEHEKYGSIFENFVICEILKRHLNAGRFPDLYYYRDNHQVEIDLIDCTEIPGTVYEIKSGATFKADFIKTINNTSQLIKGDFNKKLIYNGNESFDFKGVEVINPFNS